MLACLMLVTTAWGGSARAAMPECSDTMEQAAVHVAGDCEQVPADADKNYPHCHTGCHGHHVATPAAGHATAPTVAMACDYAPAAPSSLSAHRPELMLRPPQA